MKIKVFTVMAIVAFTFSPQAAIAHAQLTASMPLSNQIVKGLPKLVWIEFDGNLMTFGDKNPNEIKVVDSKLKRVDIGGTIVGGARISCKIKLGIPQGRYQVRYRIVSEDGHPVEGSYYFYYQSK
ncbi:MAG: copper resistance protein CopC [Candidatus Planktophila sp.]